MTIGLDVDGCLSDFNPAYIDLMIKSSGRDLFPPRPFDIITWNYPESYGYTTEEVKAVWNLIKHDILFWRELNPYPDAQRFLDLIPDKTNLYFITQRVGKYAKMQTMEWLYRYGVKNPTVLVSADKGAICKALNIDYYIDDKNENCLDVQTTSPKTKGFMLARTWNQAQDGIPRLNTLGEFLCQLT